MPVPVIILSLLGLSGTSTAEIAGSVTVGTVLRATGAWLLKRSAGQIGKQVLKQTGKQVLNQTGKQMGRNATKQVAKKITTKGTQTGAKQPNSIFVKETQTVQKPKVKVQTTDNKILHEKRSIEANYSKWPNNPMPKKSLW